MGISEGSTNGDMTPTQWYLLRDIVLSLELSFNSRIKWQRMLIIKLGRC